MLSNHYRCCLHLNRVWILAGFLAFAYNSNIDGRPPSCVKTQKKKTRQYDVITGSYCKISGGHARESRSYYRGGKKVKEDLYDFVYADGTKFRKGVSYFEDEQKVRQVIFNETSPRGNRREKVIIYFEKTQYQSQNLGSGLYINDDIFAEDYFFGDSKKYFFEYSQNKKRRGSKSSQKEIKVREETFNFTHTRGIKFKKGIVYYDNGNKVKEERFGQTFPDGGSSDKIIRYYENNKLMKQEVIGFVYADGDTYQKAVFKRIDGRIVNEEIIDYFLKSENKVYDTVKLVRDKKNKLKKYYYEGRLLTTKPF